MSIPGKIPTVVRNLKAFQCNLPKIYEKDACDRPLQSLREKDAEYNDDTLIQKHLILNVSFQSNG